MLDVILKGIGMLVVIMIIIVTIFGILGRSKITLNNTEWEFNGIINFFRGKNK